MITMAFNNIHLDAPADWTDLSVVTLAGPTEGGFRPNVLVTRDEQTTPIAVDEYARAQIKELRKGMKKYAVHKEEATVVDGRNAFLLEHSFRTPENQAVRQMQLFVGRGNMIFTLALTSSEADFEKNRDVFAGIARSFRMS
ncbi:MAG: DcrB-related protein [Deltaproteobacteria bacterium]|nr:DcrB-related protein [Deltaproteobacteria bacterium]